MQSPVTVKLGTKRKAKGLGQKRRIIEKEESFVYIPLLQSLQALLQNDMVLAEVCNVLEKLVSTFLHRC